MTAENVLADIPDREKPLPEFARDIPPQALADYLSDLAPDPLPDGAPPAQPFDLDLLPPSFVSFVGDVSERLQVNSDFVAVALMCAAGAVVGRSASIHPKRKDDWSVVANLWGCLVGPPSSMKSPALKAALKPITAIEATARDRHKTEFADYEAEAAIAELQAKAAKANAAKKVKEGDLDGAKEELLAVEDPQPPAPSRYLVNDATVEKLGELLNENPHGLLLVRDELGGWLAKMQSEESATDRAFYLEAFNGDGRFVYDRIGRGTVHIESCCLSLVGGIQPSRIAPLVRDAVTGAVDDGLVQRLQLAVWPDTSRHWRLVDRWPNSASRERVNEVFAQLDRLRLQERRNLHFAPDAQQLFNEWYTAHMQTVRNADLHPALQSHLLKFPKTIPALALLFELIEGGRDAVGVEATARALDWSSYLESHAARLYGAATNAPLMGAQLILERRDRLPEPFTARDVVRRGWAALDRTAAVNDALGVLLDHLHLISYRVEGEAGGRPSTKYFWRMGNG